MNSKDILEDNKSQAKTLALQAVSKGADLICFPENVLLMSSSKENLFALSHKERDNPNLDFFVDLARKNRKWILVGSLSVKIYNEKLANRSYLIDFNGEIVGHYDKIHLFDVDLPNGVSYRESDSYISGQKAVIIKTSLANFGLTICYDLRFPNLYRDIALKRANVIFVPSAFTKTTGQIHWHALLRARAIETGCYIIAPAQTGEHPKGRETFGHSLIIGPDGTIIQDAGELPGVITATLDLDKVIKSQSLIPSLFLNPRYSVEIH